MNISDGWHITHNPKPIPDRRFDYDFSHDNHDGDNGLCGTGDSVADCLKQIEEIEVNQ